jgi:hypothetical protein
MDRGLYKPPSLSGDSLRFRWCDIPRHVHHLQQSFLAKVIVLIEDFGLKGDDVGILTVCAGDTVSSSTSISSK